MFPGRPQAPSLSPGVARHAGPYPRQSGTALATVRADRGHRDQSQEHVRREPATDAHHVGEQLKASAAGPSAGALPIQATPIRDAGGEVRSIRSPLRWSMSSYYPQEFYTACWDCGANKRRPIQVPTDRAQIRRYASDGLCLVRDDDGRYRHTRARVPPLENRPL